jgi:hypothetical protein
MIEIGGEPRAVSRIFTASRAAALDLYGPEGLRLISERLPPEARALADSPIVAEPWLPERYVLAWQEAVWEGPAHRDEAALRLYAKRNVEFGFGRVRRILVNLVTPATLCVRAAELWRDEHTHGEISAQPDGHTVRIELRDHPYVTRPVARLVMAESLRAAAALTRVRVVTETHQLVDDTLRVDLRWS